MSTSAARTVLRFAPTLASSPRTAGSPRGAVEYASDPPSIAPALQRALAPAPGVAARRKVAGHALAGMSTWEGAAAAHQDLYRRLVAGQSGQPG